MLVSVIVLLINLTIVFSSYLPKQHESCDAWALNDLECVNNPSFMWSSCLGSCYEHAKDDNEMCAEWSRQGECTNNPTYIHIHCPESCQKALVWNPWARRAVGLANAPIDANEAVAAGTEPCNGYPVDVFGVAHTIQMRIARFMEGQYQHVTGLSITAPTEFNGLVGMAEACLYALRLYEVVIVKGARQEDAEQLSSGTFAAIKEINDVLSRGWSSDPLQLNLPRWSMLVKESHNVATEVIRSIATKHGKETFDFCRPVKTPALKSITQYFIGKNPNNYKPIVTALFSEVDSVSAAKGYTFSEYRVLNNGVKMPVTGLGTWQMQGQQVIDAVLNAIKIGYRSIDTAQAYMNEADVGIAIEMAIQHRMVNREELFIASKLSNPNDAGYDGVRALVFRQLKDLRIDYLDLYMLHSPLPNEQIQIDTWRGLEKLVEEGYIKTLGISNFNEVELAKLLNSNLNILPAVIQNKVDPYHVGKQLDNHGDNVINLARNNNILVVAYSTISSYPFTLSSLQDPIIKFLAAKYSYNDKQRISDVELEWVAPDGSISDSITEGAMHGTVTPAQILLRWALQKGFAVIPRSSDANRLTINYNALTMDRLAPQDMDLIDTLQLLVSSPVSFPVTV